MITNKENILITGGCGFLGQYLTNDLIKEFPNIKVRILDLKPPSCSIFDFSDNANVEIITGKDICNVEEIEDYFNDIGIIIHLAGVISFSLKDKEILEKVNITGTRNLLEIAEKYGIKNFIHVSSVAALGYNNDKDNPINEDYKFDWDIAKKGEKYYMLTKYLGDLEVRNFAEKGLNTVLLRPGLMYGPGDITNSSRMITAINNGKIPCNMPGGTNVVDVRDVSKGIIAAMKKGKSGGDYLLSGYNLTFKEINKTIAKTLDVKPPKWTMPQFLNYPLFKIVYLLEKSSKKKIELTADNIDSSFKFRYFDNSKAKNELNWEPEIDFEKTIKDTIDWLVQNDFLEG